MTFFCGVLDAASRTFRYCNAGHPYPTLVSSGAVRTLDQGGGVLGVFPAWTYQDSSVDLSSGDRLLLFTDGIIEAREAKNSEWEKSPHSLRRTRRIPPRGLISSCWRGLRSSAARNFRMTPLCSCWQ